MILRWVLAFAAVPLVVAVVFALVHTYAACTHTDTPTVVIYTYFAETVPCGPGATYTGPVYVVEYGDGERYTFHGLAAWVMLFRCLCSNPARVPTLHQTPTPTPTTEPDHETRTIRKRQGLPTRPVHVPNGPGGHRRVAGTG